MGFCFSGLDSLGPLFQRKYNTSLYHGKEGVSYRALIRHSGKFEQLPTAYSLPGITY
jgi:hypothetical protein